MHVLEISVIWAVVTLAFAMLFHSLRMRFAYLRAGLPDDRFNRHGERFKGLILEGFVQLRMTRDLYAGLYHLLIFWGFCVLALRSGGVILEGLFPGFHLTRALGPLGPGYQFTKDIFVVLVLLGIGMAFVRRLLARPRRLENSRAAWFTLSLIAILMVTDLLSDGALILLQDPSWKTSSPVGLWMAGLLQGQSPMVLSVIFKTSWWIHLVVLLGFMNYLPYSKHFHVFTSLFNLYFRELDPLKRMAPMDLEAEHFGINRIQDLTWKQMLDLYTCTECGRCTEVCPTTRTGKPLRPKNFGNDLRDYLNATPLDKMGQDQPVPEDRPLLGGPVPEGAEWKPCDAKAPWSVKDLGGAISSDTIWACTTCGYCEHACPLQITFVDKLVGMRRHLTLEQSDFPAEAQQAFVAMERRGNPWNLPPSDRAKWAEGMAVPHISEVEDAEFLFWVGCAGSYDATGQKVSKALVKLLKAAGVKFGILGEQETCTGDSARRLGNEYLFQTLAEQNIGTLSEHKVKKILTNCPHCLDTLKNEYPAFGGRFEVVHGTQFVAELVRTGRLQLTEEVNTVLTYHDPCYLARYNAETEAPREILRAIPGLSVKEMEHHGANTMCCGAGGGRFWLEEKLGSRINHARFEQAQETGAKGIAVGCPFCNVMLNNAAGEVGHGEVETHDVLELAAKALKPKA